ncbi:tRNA (adenosine(37)-N6)-dimethylallyltransferase MiaA [Parahalioglobus pacificus]|uniref:tRNA dimethylallyltransferase n=1 Tax=Parahalioglobus pacificus TaxID=930806 RepID=A0A919CM06_9GAMM|nr:tRNA (adenosine(37)-N6)-dimethylallyltransferase MiaA [Halioglobus pacificus]GHD38849.1 tRNA dimethylallyltransferase [Halioglobus pacificus]
MATLPVDVVCIMGPTASGKTALAESLSRHLECDLISVDSALVYTGLDIGAARPDLPHALVDIRDPAQVYSAAEFAADALKLIEESVGRGRLPVLVGGTMLYFRALLQGLSPMPEADQDIRRALEEEAQAIGWPALHQQLAAVDPVAAAQIHPNHSQRISRALEVYRASGVPISQWQSQPAVAPLLDRYRTLQLAIAPTERSVLHDRIRARFEIMMRQGFLEEVAALYARDDIGDSAPALRAVGYRQLWEHLAGRCTLDEAIDKGIAATRQLAKRQLTWLRQWPDLQWIHTDERGNVVYTTLSDSEEKFGDPVNPLLKYLGINPT